MAGAEQVGNGVPRRLVLGGVLGAAAAGFVGSEALDRTRSEPRTTSTSAASKVSVAPDGELVADDVQDALSAVYRRTSALARRDDLLVAHEIADDFVLRSGQIGGGWFTEVDGLGAKVESALDSEGGVVRLSTGTSLPSRTGMHLGLGQHAAAPVFTMEWRIQLDTVATEAEDYVLFIGAVDVVTAPGRGATVGNGMYFLYDRAEHGPNWQCGCATDGKVVFIDTGRKPNNLFYRFGITSDGDGLVRFYINDSEVGSTTEHVPGKDNRYGQGIQLTKTAGSTPAGVNVDWFYLRRELPR